MPETSKVTIDLFSLIKDTWLYLLASVGSLLAYIHVAQGKKITAVKRDMVAQGKKFSTVCKEHRAQVDAAIKEVKTELQKDICRLEDKQEKDARTTHKRLDRVILLLAGKGVSE